jgi:hypothetical protein
MAQTLRLPSEAPRPLRLPGEELTPQETGETTVGGILQATGVGLMSGATFVPQAISSSLFVAEDALSSLVGTDLDLGAEGLDRIVDEARDFWRVRIGDSKAEQLIGSAAESIGALASTAAVIVASGGTASSLLLPSMAAGAGIEKTAESLEEGAPKLNAYGAGILTTATEYLTEKIPIGKISGPGVKLMKDYVIGGVADIFGEMAATATEMSIIDKRILGKDHHLSAEQYFDILKDTAIVSVITSAGLSAGSQVIQNELVKAQTSPEAIEALKGESEAKTARIIDAISSIAPPEQQVATSVEKTEPGDMQAIRDDSKSEFPQHTKQQTPIIPEEQLELFPETLLEPEDTGVEEPDIHTEEPFKDSGVAGMMEASKGFSKEQRTKNAKGILKVLTRGVVDVTGNLKKMAKDFGTEGKKVIQDRVLVAGAAGRSFELINRFHREIYGGLKKAHHDMVDGYIFAKRNLEIRRNKGTDRLIPGNLTEAQLQGYIDSIPPNLRDTIEERADYFWQVMDTQLEELHTEGLITPELLSAIRDQGQFYSPQQVLEWVDPIRTETRGGRKISVRDSGLELLTDKGTTKLVETDSSLLLSQVIARAQTRIFRNRAGLSLIDLARTHKDNGIVSESPRKGTTKETYEIRSKRTGELLTGEVFDTKTEANRKLKPLGNKNNFIVQKRKIGAPEYAPAAAGFDKVSVMENGIRKEMVMPSELAREWVESDPLINATLANTISWITGTKILRPMATGLNPEFAITNVPRDLAHIWLTTAEYSAFSPKAAIQLTDDILAVAGDAFFKKGLWNDYNRHGGTMPFLSTQGRPVARDTIPKIKRKVDKLVDLMGAAGEFSETLTRLALMRRAMRNGASEKQATFIARNYLDFSQGGSVVKALDSAIPFLNASVQGTRGIVRAAWDNPAVFLAKSFQIGATAIGLLMANRYTNPEAYDQIDDKEKVGNWIITLPEMFSFRDKEGNKRFYYIKIAKDQGQRVIATAFESMAKMAMGEQIDVDQVTQSVMDFLPLLPTEVLPPTGDMILGYWVNKDFWRREDIWRGPEVLPQEEYNKYTPTPFIKVGQSTGLSPVRLKYAMEQLFTSGNIWTSLVGKGINDIVGDLPEVDQQRVAEEILLNQPGIRRVLESTRPDIKQSKEIKEAKIQANTDRWVTTREFDTLTERLFNGQTTRQELTEYIKAHDINERKRLLNRFKAASKLKDVPNKRYWLNLLTLPPEARAVNYWNTWVQLDESGRKDLDRMSFKVPNFRSKRFNVQFLKLRKFGQEAGR